MKTFGKLLISTALPLSLSMQAYTQERPNVILIMTDDQGYGELSCHGNPVLKTPNLDKLASQSVRFGDFHVGPMCTPTRGQLMCGFDAARNGAVNVSSGRTLLRQELPTMANYFENNGYNTGLFGKWHLGDNYPYSPEFRGFKETLSFPSSHIGSAPDFWGNDYFDDTYLHNGKREKYTGYCTDVFFTKAMEWITECQKNKKPFFVYLPTNAPHYPHYAPQDDIQAIEKDWAASSLAGKEIKTKTELIKYLAMIRHIDTNIGVLRDFLKKAGLDKNTIIIFLTDNGSTFANSYYNAGMRGQKTDLWEGGHRVPLFIHHPNGGSTKPHDVNGLTTVQDILPTLIDICNLKTEKPLQFDGISLGPQIRNNLDAPDERMLVINYSRFPSGFDYPSPYAPSIVRKEEAAVLWKRWRLIENMELYNLDEDPMQTMNVIEKHPDVAMKMMGYLDQWWSSVESKLKEVQRVVIGNEKENPALLTSCEWLDVYVDQQEQVLNGIQKNGFWLLQVDQPGTYEFELRRWPRELDIPLSGSVDGGKKMDITSARIYIDNNGSDKKIFSHFDKVAEVSPEDKSVKFKAELGKGPITLHTWFRGDKGKVTYCGAYYVYVKRPD